MQNIKELTNIRDWTDIVEGKFQALNAVVDKIDERIDHYEPYREILDSDIMKEIRKELILLRNEITGEEDA